MTAFGSVAVLVAGAAVAGALSVRSTAGQVLYPPPPAGDPAAVAGARAAAEADLSSGSFVGDVSATTRRRGYSGTESYTLVYQAPDRSELIPPPPATGGALITIGDIRYSETAFSASGPAWVYSKVPRGEQTGAQMAIAYLEIFRHNSGVLFTPSGYRLVIVATVSPDQAKFSSIGAGEEEAVVTASVERRRITAEVLKVRSPRSFAEIQVRYRDFGSAPAITTPVGAQKLPAFP